MASIVLTLKILGKSAGFYRQYNFRKNISSVKTIKKKMPLPSANLAQFLLTIDAKNIFAVFSMGMGIFLQKVHKILLYDAGQFYVKNKMAAE